MADAGVLRDAAGIVLAFRRARSEIRSSPASASCPVSGAAACADLPWTATSRCRHAIVGGHDRIGEAGGDAVVGLDDALLEQPFRTDQPADLLIEREVQFDGAL